MPTGFCRMISRWFLAVVALIIIIHSFALLHVVVSAAGKLERNKLSSAINLHLVGTVYCHTCFHQDPPTPTHLFNNNNNNIPAALVAVECRPRGKTTEPFFRQEVQTDKNGQFRLDLPPLSRSHLKACSVQLLRTTTQTYCAAVPSLPVTSSNSIRIKSRKEGTAHGIFTFKPMKQPDLCSQNTITHRSSPSNFDKQMLPKPTITNIHGFFDPIPPIPLLPPPSLVPPVLPSPPSLLPPVLPSPPSLLPPNPFNPPSPPSLLPPNPFNPPSPPSLLPPNPFKPPSAPSLFPPNPFPLPPLIPGVLPSPPPPPLPAFPIPLPPLIPIPPFPGIPPASSSSSTKKTSSPGN